MNVQEIVDALEWWQGTAGYIALRGPDGKLGPRRKPYEPFLEFLIRSHEASITDGLELLRDAIAKRKGWEITNDHHGKYYEDKHGDWVADIKFNPKLYEDV